MRVLTSFALTMALAGCAPSTSETGQVESPLQTAPAAKVDISTPDKAIKSYWATLDASRIASQELFAPARDWELKHRQRLDAVVMPTLYPPILSEPNALDTFSRDINSVAIESESRAVVEAVVRNTSPIEPGAEVDDWTAKQRRDGDRYRYILERAGGGWKVSEVWGWEHYPTEGWKRQLPAEQKPRAPALTYEGR